MVRAVQFKPSKRKKTDSPDEEPKSDRTDSRGDSRRVRPELDGQKIGGGQKPGGGQKIGDGQKIGSGQKIGGQKTGSQKLGGQKTCGQKHDSTGGEKGGGKGEDRTSKLVTIEEAEDEEIYSDKSTIGSNKHVYFDETFTNMTPTAKQLKVLLLFLQFNKE